MRNELPSALSIGSQSRPIASRILFGLLLMPLCLVAFRVVAVQATMQDRFATPWTVTSTSENLIPARNGRIVTADGIVLARDLAEFDLQVHYRWIEEPANEKWLILEARSRLSSAERRKPELVEQAKLDVLEDRRHAWAELADLIGDFPDRRAAIQTRVERIREVVLKRRDQRETETPALAPTEVGFLQTIWRELTTAPERSSNDPLILKEEIEYHTLGSVPEEAITRIHDRPTRFRGMRIATRSIRDYPQGELASHVVGFRAKPAESEIDDVARLARGLSDDTTIGRAGVERSYDRVLRGRSGVEQVERRRDGLEIGRSPARQPLHGQDVVLTIDSRLQHAAESALDEALVTNPSAVGGAVVLMDVETGAMLAAASGPRISLDVYRGTTSEQWNRIVDDPRRPLFPRVTQMAIPPGSVFKLVTSIAALESGWDPTRQIFCQGYFSKPDSERCALYRAAGYGHDRIAIDAALGMSCNVFFFELAGLVKAGPLRDWAGRCGFGWETGIDLPSEAAGRIPDENGFPYAGSVRQFAIGQGEVLATPLQVARLTAAIANGGRLLQPYTVQPNEASSQSYQAETLALSPTSLEALRLGMQHAVEGPLGTARSLSTLPVTVAGKTGSAEVGGDKPSHAWFTGYFPLEAPRYAITVAVEHGGSGGQTAAPIAAKLVQAVDEIETISRQ